MTQQTSTAPKQWPTPAVPIRYALELQKNARWEDVPGLPLSRRDLGLGGASDGAMVAAYYRVKSKSDALAHGWTTEPTSFHLLYMMSGKAKMVTASGREVALGPDDCVSQPNLFTKNKFDFDAGSELLEMYIPASKIADMGPAIAEPNVARYSPETFITGDGPRRFFAYRDLGTAKVTDRKIHIHVVKAVAQPQGGTGWHHHTMSQLFAIFSGGADLAVKGVGTVPMVAGDAMCIGAGTLHDVPTFTSDYSLIEVCIPADYDTVAAPAAPA